MIRCSGKGKLRIRSAALEYTRMGWTWVENEKGIKGDVEGDH